MTRYALILDDTVWGIEHHPKMSVSHPAMTWVACGDDPAAVIGATWDGQAFALLSAGEAAALVLHKTSARQDRDARLAQCDWTQMAGAPLDDAAQGAGGGYWQGLRDVPGQGGFPDTVTCPAMPGKTG